jgi:outer membrane scaffolding protein for murein synthesis (MipA/OmpV family)
MKSPFLIAALLAATSASAADENVLTLGGGVAAAARYSGSDELQAAPIIAIDYQMANGFYASTLRGLGYGRDFGNLHLSAALGYRGERTDKEETNFGGRRGSDKLKGMGVVKGSGTGVFGVGYKIVEGLVVSGQAEAPLSHRENGRSGNIALTGTLVSNSVDQVTITVGANIADSKYAQTYYGVTADQSARSGYKRFTPKGGMYEGAMNMAWRHQIDDRWSVTGMVGYTALVRDAAKSPIVFRSSSPVAGVYASYRY